LAITRSATVAGRGKVEACICISDLACYIELLQEEEECLVKHAKRLSAAMASAETTAVALNAELYAESRRFEQERQRAYELGVAKAAASARTVLHCSSSSVDSSFSASY
jgi:phage shock protein A